MKFLRENGSRAKLVILFLWLSIGSEILNIISSYLQFDVIDDYFNDFDIKDSDFEFVDNLDNLVSIVNLIVFILSGIFFIQWFRRAYFNLHLVSKKLKFTEGWAAGSWFVPFINLIRPVEIMKELYTKTNEILIEKNVRFDQKKNIINLWWAFWIISAVISNFIMRYSLNVADLNELQNLTLMTMASSIIGIISGFLALKVVKDYVYMEEKLNNINFSKQESSVEILE